MRIEKAAAVARALVYRSDFDRGEIALELLEIECEWRGGGIAADVERPFVGRDLGDRRQVIADEERLVRSELFGKIG